MSGGQEDVSSQPLVIVRRRRNTEEAHHGGVWKIAYADFMTAMMAFFLVMWLINAADKKTIVQVAAYFNPVRLTDRTITPKGLEEMTEDAKPADTKGKEGHLNKVKEKDEQKHAKDSADSSAEGSAATAGAKSARAQAEQTLFDDPADTLAKLAGQAKIDQAANDIAPADNGDSDPFDRATKTFRKPPAAKRIEQKPFKPAAKTVPSQGTPPSPPLPSQIKSEPAAKTPAPLTSGVEVPPAPANAANKDEKPTDKKDDKLADKSEAAKKIEAEISSAISNVAHKLPHVEVKATSEGILISLTDDANFGMFEVGSAKPRPEMVLIMDKVGVKLRDMGGKIVVRGHTDSRAYKSGVYDNWRLSAARAQMAYYMLVRGGVPEQNFAAVEGRADRDPKVPSDTEAAQNRRIDILIRDAQP